MYFNKTSLGIVFTAAAAMLSVMRLEAQVIELTPTRLHAVQVNVSEEQVDGTRAIRVVKDAAVTRFDEPTFARIGDLTFGDGTIEVRVLSRLLADAPDFARGFIGVAFRINEDNSAFECMYIRPANGRSDDQVRRNHTTQYFAYPDYKFDRLRKESPEKYESYVDVGLDEWISLKIVVKGARAWLYVNGGSQPALVVNDLKLGPSQEGGIGLWVDVGTAGYFSDLRVLR